MHCRWFSSIPSLNPGFPDGVVVENPPANARGTEDVGLIPGWDPGWEHFFLPLDGEDAWRKKWQLTPVFLPGKSQGQRSLVGYSPWGHK